MRRKTALESIYAEIENMESMEAMKPILYSDIPSEFRHQIIASHMFLKDKYKGDGSFDKTKARLTVNGDQQDPETINDTTAPTVNPISVNVLLSIAAARPQYKLSAHDIKTAFLTTSKKGLKNRIFIRIPPEVVEHWVYLHPERKRFVNSKGAMYAELGAYVYGLPEASRAFNELLNETLIDLGFKPTKADKCMYTKRNGADISIICVHVDDLLVLSPNESSRDDLVTSLEKTFTLVSQHDDVSYLGMTIKRDSTTGKIRVTQEGFITDLLKENEINNVAKPPPTPATASLLEVKEDSPPCDPRKYKSIIMSLMYLARFTRPDILMPVSYLATRSQTPTEDDMSKTLRILRYLYGTKRVGITILPSNLTLRVYADASHVVHTDGKGHSGIMITLGTNVIFVRSTKIRCVTRSSSESELFSLEDASTYVVWLRFLLKELGLVQRDPTTIYQDNKSTIIMASQGGNFKRTKHLLCKQSFIKERLTSGDIVLRYLDTKSMIADMLTKPLDKVSLRRCMQTAHVV
jgi:hypothetical protein